jgi:RNA polymerase sigma-70 factor (ECF subfamily)
MTVDLADVLRELAPRLFRYAVGRTGDASLAEDVAQDCLTALVERWQRHGPPDSAEAFVFAIARRRAFRAVVRRRAWLPIEHVLGARDGRPDPEANAIARASRAQVVAAIGKLPGRDREVLLLVVAAGLNTAQAAKTLGVSPSALKVRMFRARRRLAALLEKDDGTRT